MNKYDSQMKGYTRTVLNGHCVLEGFLLEHTPTWLRSSEGLILAKREKSIIVICLATSSGSKSKMVSNGDTWEGIYDHNIKNILNV